MEIESIKELAKVKKELLKVTREEIALIREMEQLEDDRFYRNYQRTVEITNFQRRTLIKDALLGNGLNVITSEISSIPERDFTRIINNFKSASNALDEITGEYSEKTEQEEA